MNESLLPIATQKAKKQQFTKTLTSNRFYKNVKTLRKTLDKFVKTCYAMDILVR